MGRRVLVTGGAGFIGSHVCERFERAGFAVRVLDDLSTGERANCDPAWRLIEADVRNARGADDAIDTTDAPIDSPWDTDDGVDTIFVLSDGEPSGGAITVEGTGGTGTSFNSGCLPVHLL